MPVKQTKQSYFEVGAILRTFYAFERNIRIENELKTGFYANHVKGNISRFLVDDLSDGSSVLYETPEATLGRLSPLKPVDWYVRFNTPTVEEAVNKLFWEYADDEPKMITWLQEKAPKNIYLEKVLTTIHQKGILFRIESGWDLGFDIKLIKKTVRPSRVQIDNRNAIIREALEKAGKTADLSSYEDLPLLDWKATHNTYSIEEIRDWFVKRCKLDTSVYKRQKAKS